MGNTDKKILFFDIDGTLITNDTRRFFPDSAKKAIKMARERGHLTFINTGRVYVNIEDEIRSAGFDGYVCGCGTNIRVGDKNLFHNTVSRKRCYDIAKKARECDMMAIYEYIDYTCYDRECKEDGNKEILDYFRSMKRKMVDDIESSDFVFDKLAAWYSDGNDKVNEFLDYVGEDFNCIGREGNFYEIVPKGFSKATGIKYLQEYYDIPIDNIYVFGDSNNDLDMLKYATNSIAMGCCTKEVLDASAYHTDTVEEDGIYNAMKHFGVI